MKHIQQTFNFNLDENIIKCTLFSYEELSAETLLSFDFNNKHYVFQIFNNRHNMINILRRYILETNDFSFAFYDQDNLLNMSCEQKKSFREKVAKDFMNCLNYFIKKYRSQILTFAVFLHGEDYFDLKHEESYSKYIEKIVCQFIIENKFILQKKFPIFNWKADKILV